MTFEATIEVATAYDDPFNDLDVDAIFERGGQAWRVPMFWHGERRWTVRFTPPTPAEYTLRFEGTDPSDPDLGIRPRTVGIGVYEGLNDLMRRGPIVVGASGRHFEHADGTPFYWLGDTWWTGLSDRLTMDGFRTLTADRVSKGFTAIQLVAGLIPTNEELAPIDPGFRNEGGFVWDPDFERINPVYFDHADDRIRHLLDNGLVPVIVGGWNRVLRQIGVPKMQKHWRYLIARYGAFPVLWVVGGEVYDPPGSVGRKHPGIEVGRFFDLRTPGWSDVARYIRATDPYRHPLTAHEVPPPYDDALEHESLTDFDLFQPGHGDWGSIATAVSVLQARAARTEIVKPVVVGEIHYEKHLGGGYEDCQRAAFWLSMLNGAAGFTYGTIETAEVYSGDRPLHRQRYSFYSWEEAMGFPGSTQVGLGAKLLRDHDWWRLEAHPEWVLPRGTTEHLSESILAHGVLFETSPVRSADAWQDVQLPFAAGIPGELRVIYVPNVTRGYAATNPTVLGLEPGVSYRATLWEPSLGIRIDLGTLRHADPVRLAAAEIPRGAAADGWVDLGPRTESGSGSILVMAGVEEADVIVSAVVDGTTPATLVLRVQDGDNHVAAVYSPEEGVLYLQVRRDGADGPRLGAVRVPALAPSSRLSVEVQGTLAAATIIEGGRTLATPIVDVPPSVGGRVGVVRQPSAPDPTGRGTGDHAGHLEVLRNASVTSDDALDRTLMDAWGVHRGELEAIADPDPTLYPWWHPWDRLGRDKRVLLGAARLVERLPYRSDWIFLLEGEARLP